jgi:glutamate/tyrosine decarboxylase-like PLP-dependent enzyme
MSIKGLLHDTAERAGAYLDALPGRRVSFAPEAIAKLEELIEPLPAEGARPDEIIARLDRLGSAASVAMAGPRYFGFVIGGSLPASLAANWLASAWDQNTGLYEVTPATATLETQALTWLLDLLRLPGDCAGSFVTGATVANFTALAAARNRVLAHAGWDVEADGLFGAPPVRVLIGTEAHPSVYKSLGMLGLGRNRVVRVPTDDQGRMRVDELAVAGGGPTIVIAQVGNVNTGACDAIGNICAVAKPQGAWVHVDGAFGLWASASPKYRHLLAGVEQADSWATDAHKWLNVPYDSGVAFVRDRDALKAAMSITADYLPTHSARRNPSDYTPELSRRARGVEIWAALCELGRTGVAELVERCCGHAQHFATGLRAAGHDVLNDVVLNQVLVSFGGDQETRRVIKAIQDDGTCWCGVTVWHGTTAMRISVSNWSTTTADVERSLAAILRIAAS